MSKSIRVMIVDDSALYRKAISDVLRVDPNIEIVGTAPNGKIALAKIADKAPDLITLDMEMPVMDGLTTLEHLRRDHPSIKTIVFSTHTEKGAEMTIRALNRGAADFVAKPSSAASPKCNISDITEVLLPKVGAFAAQLVNTPARPAIGKIEITSKSPLLAAPRDVIAIGISTGGPSSLMNLFEQLPTRMKQAILIVQHMPPIFTRKLAEQLCKVGTIPVGEAVHGEPIVPSRAYVAPGDYHMEAVRVEGEERIRLSQTEPVNYCRPSVDVLFRSVANLYGNRAVGVVMTGMGKDGLKGSHAIKLAQAALVAQDEATSVVWGMPRFVVQNGLADVVAPLDKIYESINKLTI